MDTKKMNQIHNYINQNWNLQEDYHIIVKNFLQLEKFFLVEKIDCSKKEKRELIKNNIKFQKSLIVLDNLPEEIFAQLDFDSFLLDFFKLYQTIKKQKQEQEKKLDSRTKTGIGLSCYFMEISGKRILSKEEQNELKIRIDNHDEEARKELIETNLKLVVAIAKYYSKNSSISLEDLIEEGNYGLMRAIEHYDVNQGVKFSSYAKFWIQQAIQRYIIFYSKTIRIPSGKQEKIFKIKKAQEYFHQAKKRNPTIEELALKTGLKPKIVSALLEIPEEPIVSLDSIIEKPFEDSDISQLVTEEDSVEKIIIQRQLQKQFYEIFENTNLTDCERDIIIHLFGLYGKEVKTLTELSKKYQITLQKTWYIKNRALKKILKEDKNEILKTYMI